MDDQLREASAEDNCQIHVISRRPLIVEFAGSFTEAECGLLLAAAQQYPNGPSDRLRAIEELFSGLRSDLKQLQKVNSDLQDDNKKLQQQLDVAFPSCPHTPKDSGHTMEETPSSSDPSTKYPSTDSMIGLCDSAVANQAMQEYWIACVDSDSDECVKTPSESDDGVRPVPPKRNRGSLMRSTNMTNSHEDGLTREQRVNKLHGWFTSLLLDGNEGLPACQLQSIVQRVHCPVNGYSVVPFWGPPREAMSIAQIEKVIEQFFEASAHHADDTVEGGHVQKWDGSQQGSVQGDSRQLMLYFPAFADMILFDCTDGFADCVRQDAFIIRDALMRTHIDALVAHHAHIRKAPEDAEQCDWKIAFFDTLFDPLSCVLILINAIATGMSSDIPWDGWDVLEVAFTIFFLFEVLLKTSLHGLRKYFLGPDWSWNWFDTSIVGLALIDLVFSWIVRSSDGNVRDLSVLRLARIMRLTRMLRLVRVLKLRIFKELLLMIKGVVAGLRTLVWAFVMLLAIVYACSVILRQTVGYDRHVMLDKYNTVLFGSVPWSMFNTFRCFMSDCTLPDGTPIAGHLNELYGFRFVIPYSFMMMFIAFGIFNMVTAVFVENVIESARQRNLSQKEVEQRRTAKLLSKLIVHLASKPTDETVGKSEGLRALSGSSLSRTSMPSVFGIGQKQTWRTAVCRARIQGEVTREAFLVAIRDPYVGGLIDRLELNVGDRRELFDVLDSDGNGSLDVGELIAGIMKLRSTDTKEDVVALILSMRVVRTMLGDMGRAIAKTNDKMNELLEDSTPTTRSNGKIRGRQTSTNDGLI